MLRSREEAMKLNCRVAGGVPTQGKNLAGQVVIQLNFANCVAQGCCHWVEKKVGTSTGYEYHGRCGLVHPIAPMELAQ